MNKQENIRQLMEEIDKIKPLIAGGPPYRMIENAKTALISETDADIVNAQLGVIKSVLQKIGKEKGIEFKNIEQMLSEMLDQEAEYVPPKPYHERRVLSDEERQIVAEQKEAEARGRLGPGHRGSKWNYLFNER